MIGATLRRPANWNGFRRLRLQSVGYSSYSTLSSAIKISSIPAPHAGSISVVSLNRPQVRHAAGTIDVFHSPSRRIVTLTGVKARNAISRQLLEELTQVVDGLHREGGKGSTRALILASESDGSFCAGADLKERVGMSPEEVAAFLTQLRATFARLVSLPIPTISAVSSVAFGGGLELALCTNLRVFTSNASVGLPETRLAIIPGAGGTFRLPGLIGETRARDMILTGRRVSGPEAYFLGLCDRLVEVTEEEAKVPGVARGKVLAQAETLAREICEGGPVAIRAAMQAINGWESGQESENKAYEMVLPTADRTEALKAFGEKRKPVFKGRYAAHNFTFATNADMNFQEDQPPLMTQTQHLPGNLGAYMHT